MLLFHGVTDGLFSIETPWGFPAIGSLWMAPRYATQPPEHRGIPGNCGVRPKGSHIINIRYTHIHIYIYVYVFILFYVYTYVFVYTQYTFAICVYIYTCIFIYLYIYLFIYISIYLYVYLYGYPVSTNSLVVSTFCFNHGMMIQYVYTRNWDAPPNASIIHY